METKLINFQNSLGGLLRGILVDANSKKGVICLHGFERNASAEPKFKFLSDSLAKKGISSFRFDYAGTGISDGNFSDMTVEKMVGDLESAIKTFKDETKITEIGLVAHSLSACVVGEYLKKRNDLPYKVVLLAPALNQKELLRYYFSTNSNKDKEITWQNYRESLDEEKFLEDSKKNNKIAKAHYISNKYFLENLDRDYSEYFKDYSSVLLVHGDEDSKVPLESLNIDFPNKVIVKGGDHDLEKPDMIKQWLDKTTNFLR